jgi:hypothetical protein
MATQKKYESYYEYHFSDDKVPSKKFLGNEKPRRCKFCGKDKAGTSFKKESHIIPAALGNRSLFSFEECDMCNEKYSSFENDLIVSLEAIRAMGRSRTRKGGAKYKPRGESFIESGVGSNTVEMRLSANDPSIKMEDVGENTLRLTFEIGPHRPIFIAKELARLFLLCVKEREFSENSHLLRWINNEIQPFPIKYFRIFIPGSGLINTQLIILKRVIADPVFAPFVVYLMYRNFCFVFHVPESSFQLKEYSFSNEFKELFKNSQPEQITCNGDEALPREERFITLKYTSSKSTQ